MTAQMEHDTTGSLRANGELEDKATGIFVGPRYGQNAFTTEGRGGSSHDLAGDELSMARKLGLCVVGVVAGVRGLRGP